MLLTIDYSKKPEFGLEFEIVSHPDRSDVVTLNTEEIHHVLCTQEEDTQRNYLDGVLLSSYQRAFPRVVQKRAWEYAKKNGVVPLDATVLDAILEMLPKGRKTGRGAGYLGGDTFFGEQLARFDRGVSTIGINLFWGTVIRKKVDGGLYIPYLAGYDSYSEVPHRGLRRISDDNVYSWFFGSQLDGSLFARLKEREVNH